ncbi:MAG: ABC transporter ATP-binding protein [Gammaproteobacteria bacterium]|nr:ABC transporter ATP-binding protein [Gammaproteobacteria bacterium]
MSNLPILSIRKLSVEFSSELGVNPVLHDISFDMMRSRTTAIVGESGSGKSVTANATMRLIRSPGKITGGEIVFSPTAGTSFDILKLQEGSDEIYDLRGGKIAMIFQEPMTALSPVHTIGNQVMEAILIHQKVSKTEAFQRACEMLQRVGITQAEMRMNQYPFEFSGGMRQRVVIAMALVCQPQILICDEPTTALDVTVQAEILSLINELKHAIDTTVMFITHDLGVVAQVADDVVVMHRGRILETGTVRQVLKSPLHPYTQGLLAAMPGRAEAGQRKARLQTVSDVYDENEFAACPLVAIGDNRQVALPIDAIPSELRP